jgi:putative transposase
MKKFTRKRNRLPETSYVGRNWYFITACTGLRKSRFRDHVLVNLVLDSLRHSCLSRGFKVYAYCFMPDHVHLELVAELEVSNVPELMRDVKGKSTGEARRFGVRGLWQKGYYDHVLREGENGNAVAWYIFNNPVRKQLVQNPMDWPSSGSWVFDWRRAVAPPGEFVPPWKREVAG